MFTVLCVLAFIVFPLPSICGWIGFYFFGTIGAIIGVIIGFVLSND